MASARKLIGATNPLNAEPGTIRGDLAIQTGRNVVHGSDSPENGERETGVLARCSSALIFFWDMCSLSVSVTPPLACTLTGHRKYSYLYCVTIVNDKVCGWFAGLWFGDNALVEWENTLKPWLTE